MWLGFQKANKIQKLDSETDAGGDGFFSPATYVSNATYDTVDQLDDANADESENTNVAKSKNKRHDKQGKFTTPGNDTGVGHKGNNKYSPTGAKIMQKGMETVPLVPAGAVEDEALADGAGAGA